MADFTDPQVQAIYNQILSGQFSPEITTALADQFINPTQDAAIAKQTGNASVPAGDTMLNASQWQSLFPLTGSSFEFQGPDYSTPTQPGAFTGYDGVGNPMYAPDPYAADPQAGSDMQYLLSHGFQTGSEHLPGFTGMDALRIFGPVATAGVAAALAPAADVGAAGASAAGFGDAGAAGALGADAGAAASSGVAALSEAAPSAAGDFASAAAGGMSAIPGGSDALALGGLTGELPDLSTSGVSLGGQSIASPGLSAATQQALGATAGAAGAAGASGAADPTGSGATFQQPDVGGTTGGGSSSIQQGVNPGAGSAANPTGQFVDPAGSITSDTSTLTAGSSAPDLGSINDSSALSATNTGTFNPASMPVQQAAPVAPVSGGGAGGGANIMGGSDTLGGANDFLSPDSLQELNSANPAGTAALQNTALTGSTAPAPSIMDRLGLGGVGSFMKNNASWLVPLTSGGASAVKGLVGGGGSGGASSDVGQVAGQERAAGTQLLNQGINQTLPPGAQQVLDQQIAGIKAKYASMGQSGSSAEATDIANATATFRFNLSQTTVQNGTQLLNLAQSGYGDLARIQALSDQDLQNAIAEFGLAAGTGAVKGLT